MRYLLENYRDNLVEDEDGRSLSVYRQMEELHSALADNAVVDIFGFIEKIPEIVLVRDEGMHKREIDGAFYQIDANVEQFAIHVNARLPLGQQRFVVAHELAHYLLHRNRLDRLGGVNDVMFSRRRALLDDDHVFVGEFFRRTMDDVFERQADELAIAMLMPHDKVADEWSRNKGDFNMALAVKFVMPLFILDQYFPEGNSTAKG